MILPYAFWDSSALVPLCLTQTATEKAEAWAERFNIAVWWATRVEVYSATARLSRSGELAGKQRNDAIAAHHALARGWREIVPSDEVRDTAAQARFTVLHL